MQFVPWRRVADWECLMCGVCCKLYSVVIDFPEWLRIAQTHGPEKTVTGVNRLYIGRRTDGSCVFLCNFSNLHFCSLQQMKPRACQIWPFKILDKPLYGFSMEAAYQFGRNWLYVYVDLMCNGVRYGMPSPTFANQTLREFVEIAIGLRGMQVKTTSKAASGARGSFSRWQ